MDKSDHPCFPKKKKKKRKNKIPIIKIVCLAVHKRDLFANIVDPDQTPRSAASDLSLHCLH